MSSKANKIRNKKAKQSGGANSSGSHGSPNSELSDAAASYTRVVEEPAAQSSTPPNVEVEPRSVYNAIINDLETESPVAATPETRVTVDTAVIPTDSCSSETLMVDDLVMKFVCREFVDQLVPRREYADQSLANLPHVLSVRMFSSSNWKTSSSSSMSKIPTDLHDEDPLPLGIEEFVKKLEESFDDQSLLDALRLSEHLCVAFPRLVCFVANQVRTNGFKSLDYLLALLASIVSNKHFKPNRNTFELMLATLVSLITDVKNSTTTSDKVVVELLCLLLDEKLGPFHSQQLREKLVDLVFLPIMETTKGGIHSRCALAVDALATDRKI